MAQAKCHIMLLTRKAKHDSNSVEPLLDLEIKRNGGFKDFSRLLFVGLKGLGNLKPSKKGHSL